MNISLGANRDGIEWRKLRLPGVRDLSRNPDIPLATRMFFLASYRADPAGHAVFGPEGEIGAVLVRAGGVRYSKSQLNRALAEAKETGLLGEPSCLACLVVPCETADTDLAGKLRCPVHGHGWGWYRDEWIDHKTGRPAPPEAVQAMAGKSDYALA